AVGHGVSQSRLVRLLRHARLPRHPHAGLSLHLAEARSRMGVGSFFTSKLDEAIGWARKYSIFQYPFVTACCGMEYMATACSHYDVDRFGAGLPRFSPRQADVLFVVGTISHKMAPVLKRIYDQMTEPKWVVAFGVCTCTGGFYDNYATVLAFDVLMDLTAVDYQKYPGREDGPRFEVVYHLYSLRWNHRLRIKVRVDEDDAVVPTAVPLWPIANWLEREVWDMFGVRF